MASRILTHKNDEYEILVDQADQDLLDKPWFVDYNKTTSCSYKRIRRSLKKAERAARGTSHISLHAEVWERHHGRVPRNMTVDHIDFNPLNNQTSNLRLKTGRKNVRGKKR